MLAGDQQHRGELSLHITCLERNKREDQINKAPCNTIRMNVESSHSDQTHTGMYSLIISI